MRNSSTASNRTLPASRSRGFDVRLILALSLAGSPVAATASAAVPAAMAEPILEDTQLADCAAKSKLSKSAFVANSFELKNVTLKSGEHLTVATGVTQCVCAAQNCPTVVVLAQKGGAYRTVLSGWTIESKILPDGSAVLTSHDSAAVSDRSIYRWNGSTYAVVRSERVDARSGTVKPMSLPVAFAANASSATVSGKAAQGFGDTYTLHANAGQTMSLALRSPNGKRLGGFALYRGEALVAQADAHWSGKLPASGEYSITIDGGDETLEPYALTISIR